MQNTSSLVYLCIVTCKMQANVQINIQRQIMKQTILITGASSGFGLLIANKLHESGYNVIGTSRNPEKYASKLPFKMIALDLDSELSINTLPDRLFKEIGRIDILINNAGFLVTGIAEEIPVELGRQQFETNFWGTIKVTNAILP